MAEETGDQQYRQRGAQRRANLLGAITTACLFLLGLAIVTSPAPARAATRTITVTPDTGLSDGQNVTVSWSGFSPGATVQTIVIEECKQQITDIFADCAIVTLVAPNNGADGSGSTQYTVRSHNLNGTPFDEGFTCDANNPCAITARESFDNSDNSLVSHNIAFSAAATTTTQPGATTTTQSAATTTQSAATTTTQSATTTTAAGGTTTTAAGETTTTAGGTTTTAGATTTTGGEETTTTGGTTTTLGGGSGGNLPFTGGAVHLPLVALIGIVSIALGVGVRWFVLSPRFGGPAS